MAEIKNINAWSYKKDNVSELIADSFPYHGGSDNGENFFAAVRSNLKTNAVRQQNGSLNIDFNLQLDDVVRKSTKEENFSIGTLISNSFNSFEDDFVPTTYTDGELSGGTGIILSNKKLQSGFYLGETTSYFSQPKLGFTINVRKKWLDAPEGISEYTAIIVCENQKTGEKKKEEVSSLNNEKIPFQGLEAYDENGELIDYLIYEEVGENFPWDSNVINGEINYEKESKVAVIENRWNGTIPPAPDYDEWKIAVILLDRNDEPTEDIKYFDTIADSATYLKNNIANRYLVHIGMNAGVTIIPDKSYRECTSLVKIYIPDSVISIENEAFYLTSLISVCIPASIQTLGINVFSCCRSLVSATFLGDISVIPNNMFLGCWRLAKVILPKTLTAINSTAFKDCTALQYIELPDGIETIESSVFANSGLIKINIPKSVTTINHSVFTNCKFLTSVTINTGLVTLGVSAFNGCNLLKNIELPDSIESIGDAAFKNCPILETIIINKPENSISGAPWGAPNATVVWTG